MPSQWNARNHAILTSLGTDGDVYPYLSLGRELRRRGYEVTLATHDHFASLAAAAGLHFRSMVSAAETEQLLVQRDFWHPIKSALVLSRWGGRMIPRQFEVLKELAARGNCFLVANPGALAARLLQEHSGVQLISVVLQPWLIPSLHTPPVMMGGLTLPRWTPRVLRVLYFRLIHALGARLMGDEFRSLRASLGLKPMRQMFRWWFSPELVLGLFPEWYGPPQPDWPPQTRLAGFPLNDGRPGAHLSEDLLSFCKQGKKVFVFTFGTGMRHANELFQTAIEACGRLGQRAVLLTSYRAQLPDLLPDFAYHCEFAPFHELFPLCAAVVHHGGIGTAAKALAAGTPQLILPFAYDQLDNALRVKKLGAGNWLKSNRRSVCDMASSLAELSRAESAASARAVTARFNGRSGIDCAADHIERFGRATEPNDRD